MPLHERSAVWCEGDVIADALRDRTGWLLAREPYVCASEMGRAMSIPWTSGKHPTPGPQRYAKLVKQKLEGDTLEQNEQMWWGQFLEERVIEGLPKAKDAMTEGWSIRPCGLLIADARCSRLAATTDIWADDGHGPMCGDVKISRYAWYATKAKPRPVDYIPLDYQIQVHAQMAATGAQRGCLIQFVGNCVANAVVFQRDPVLIARIRQAAEMFWFDLEAAA